MHRNYYTEQFIMALLYNRYIIGLKETTGDLIDISIYEENETKTKLGEEISSSI